MSAFVVIHAPNHIETIDTLAGGLPHTPAFTWDMYVPYMKDQMERQSVMRKAWYRDLESKIQTLPETARDRIIPRAYEFITMLHGRNLEKIQTASIALGAALNEVRRDLEDPADWMERNVYGIFSAELSQNSFYTVQELRGEVRRRLSDMPKTVYLLDLELVKFGATVRFCLNHTGRCVEDDQYLSTHYREKRDAIHQAVIKLNSRIRWGAKLAEEVSEAECAPAPSK